MQTATISDIYELAQLVAEIGPTFEVRRLFSRIGTNEITVRRALEAAQALERLNLLNGRAGAAL